MKNIKETDMCLHMLFRGNNILRATRTQGLDHPDWIRQMVGGIWK